MDYAVVTGAGSGIGRAAAVALSLEPLTVLAVGRRLSALADTVAMAPGEVLAVSADVGTAAGRAAIAARVKRGSRVRYLVHAAGVQPLERVATIEPAPWRRVMATNVDARLFLTQRLLPALSGGGRVLFVGSLSASRARQGATAYCVSKAASFMLQACLKLELAEHDVLVTSAIPSPVNTAIVQAAMNADPAVFPDGAEFAQLQRERRLIEPEVVGRFYRWLLTRTDDESFTAQEWNIRESHHHLHWLDAHSLYGSASGN